MREYRSDRRAKVIVEVELLVPCTDSLHVLERINSRWENATISEAAVRRAFDETGWKDYQITGARRGKWLGAGYSLHDDPVTVEPTPDSTTDTSEDHDSASAGSDDPSSTADETESSAPSWDFVVA